MRREKLLLLICIGIAVLIRAGVVVLIGERNLTAEFDTLVKNLVNHGGYYYYALTESGNTTHQYISDPRFLIPSGYMPPGYPFFLAFFVWLLGSGSSSILIIELVQVGLSAVLLYYLYNIARLKFGRLTAIITALIFCFYPILVFYPSQITASNVYLILNIGAVYALFKGESQKHIKWYLIAGILFGLLILARGQMILYVPFIAFWIYRISKKVRWKPVLAFLIPLLIVLLPWSIRNYQQMGRFSPLPISSGYNLWKGNNPYATGASIKYTDAPVDDHMMPGDIKQQIKDLKVDHNYEIRRDNLYKERSLNYIFNHPIEVVGLSLRKFTFYWGHFWGIDYEYPGVNSPLYWGPWLLMLPFFLVGLYFSLDAYHKYWIFYLYFALSTGIVMIFFVLPRYRLLMLPFVIVFAAYGIIRLMENHMPEKYRRLVTFMDE